MGFRYFTRKVAIRSGFNGWVRNLVDGRVEALVQSGPDISIEFLERQLWSGPMHGEVTDLQREEIVFSESLDGFTIIEDGDRPFEVKGVSQS